MDETKMHKREISCEKINKTQDDFIPSLKTKCIRLTISWDVIYCYISRVGAH